MYAVIEQGGKQYKVSQGQTIDIELTEVAQDAKTLEMNKVRQAVITREIAEIISTNEVVK